MAECKRLRGPEDTGPTCHCGPKACSLDTFGEDTTTPFFRPGEIIEFNSPEELDAIKRQIKRQIATEESICAEADRLVSEDRGNDYGHPLDDFGKVSGMAMALWGRGPETPEEHAIYMVLVKLAREVHKPKRDNRVDAAGYLKTLDMIIDERKRRDGS